MFWKHPATYPLRKFIHNVIVHPVGLATTFVAFDEDGPQCIVGQHLGLRKNCRAGDGNLVVSIRDGVRRGDEDGLRNLAVMDPLSRLFLALRPICHRCR